MPYGVLPERERERKREREREEEEKELGLGSLQSRRYYRKLAMFWKFCEYKCPLYVLLV